MTAYLPAATAPRRTIAVLGAMPAEAAAIGRGIAAAGAVPLRLDTTRPLADALAGVDALFVAPAAVGLRSAGAAAVATAAAQAGVAHVVWAAPGGADARRAFDGAGVPCTRLVAAPTWEQMFEPALAFGRDAQEQLVLRLPLGAALVPGIAAADLGALVARICARRTWTAGLALGAASERHDAAGLAAALAEALGEPVALRPLGADRFAALPGGAALLAQLQVDLDARDVKATRFLLPEVQGFLAWAAAHAAALAPAALA